VYEAAKDACGAMGELRVTLEGVMLESRVAPWPTLIGAFVARGEKVFAPRTSVKLQSPEATTAV